MQTGFIFIRNDGQVYDTIEENGFMAYKPDIPLPTLRIDRLRVMGRDSYLTKSDGTYEDRSITIPLIFLDWEKYNKLAFMFRGIGGKLQFNYKEGYYKVSGVRGVYPRDAKGIPEIDVELNIEPFMYLERESVIIDKGAFVNYGNVDSKCKLTIEGSGDCTIYVGSEAFTIKGLSGKIILDSELMQIHDTVNNKGETVVGNLDKLILKAGENDISWTGPITKVTLEYDPKMFE